MYIDEAIVEEKTEDRCTNSSMRLMALSMIGITTWNSLGHDFEQQFEDKADVCGRTRATKNANRNKLAAMILSFDVGNSRYLQHED